MADVVRCPACGSSIAADAAWCPRCGHDLRHEIVLFDEPGAGGQLSAGTVTRGAQGRPRAWVTLAFVAVLSAVGVAAGIGATDDGDEEGPAPATTVEDRDGSTTRTRRTTTTLPASLTVLEMPDPALAGERLVLWSARREALVTLDLGTGTTAVRSVDEATDVYSILASPEAVFLQTNRGLITVAGDEVDVQDSPIQSLWPLFTSAAGTVFAYEDRTTGPALSELNARGDRIGTAQVLPAGVDVVGATADAFIVNSASDGFYRLDRSSGDMRRLGPGRALAMSDRNLIFRACDDVYRCSLFELDLATAAARAIESLTRDPIEMAVVSADGSTLATAVFPMDRPRWRIRDLETGRTSELHDLRTRWPGGPVALSGNGDWAYFLLDGVLHGLRPGDEAATRLDFGDEWRFDLLACQPARPAG